MDQLIQDPHKLAENCKYGGLKDQLSRNRMVERYWMMFQPTFWLMQCRHQAEAKKGRQPLLQKTVNVKWVRPKKGQQQGNCHKSAHS